MPDKLREYAFPIGLALFMAVAGTFPYVYGYWSAGPDEVFMGFVGRGTPGANGYVMMARQVAEGHTLIQNYMTPEPTERAYFHPEWWLYGWFARITGLSTILTFHVWRVAGVFAFVLAVYYLASVCFRARGMRRLATALITLGAGLGWILWLVNLSGVAHFPESLDLKGVTIPGYLVNKPHFIRAGIFSALQFAFLLRGEQTGRWRYYLANGLMAGCQSLIRPFHVPETFLLYLIYPGLRSIQQGRLDTPLYARHALAGAVQLPFLIPHAVVALGNPLGMTAWARQAEFLLQQVFWLGIPFVLVVIAFALKGFSHALTARKETLLLGAWLFIGWLIVNAFPYFNWSHEGFFPFVIGAPLLALLAPAPWLWRQIKARRPQANATAAGVLLLAACLPSTAIGYGRFFHDLHHPTPPWTHYVTTDVRAAFEWLHGHTPDASVVLASQNTSQFLPRFADNKVVVAHDILTAWYAEKQWQVERFWSGPGDEAFKRWLVDRYGVDFVFYGPYERQAGALSPAALPWLEEMYHGGNVTIFRVVR